MSFHFIVRKTVPPNSSVDTHPYNSWIGEEGPNKACAHCPLSTGYQDHDQYLFKHNTTSTHILIHKPPPPIHTVKLMVTKDYFILLLNSRRYQIQSSPLPRQPTTVFSIGADTSTLTLCYTSDIISSPTSTTNYIQQTNPPRLLFTRCWQVKSVTNCSPIWWAENSNSPLPATIQPLWSDPPSPSTALLLFNFSPIILPTQSGYDGWDRGWHMLGDGWLL